MHDDTINRTQLKLNPISLPMRYVLVKDLLETAIFFRLNAILSACSRFKKKKLSIFKQLKYFPRLILHYNTWSYVVPSWYPTVLPGAAHLEIII